MIFSVDNNVWNFSYKRLRNLYINYAAEGEENYAKAYATWVSPEDYLLLTCPGGVQSFLDKAKPLDYKVLCDQQQEIFLSVDFEKGEVVGHEGRHRMAALHKAGANLVAITIIPRNQNDKYNRQFIESFTVKGQSFPIDPPNKAEGVVDLRCLTPICAANKEHIYNVFGPGPVLDTFVGRKLYAVEDIFQFSSGQQVASRKRYIGKIKGFSDNPDYSKTIHSCNPFKISYAHIHDETNPIGYQDYAIEVSDFLNWIREGKYHIPVVKTPSLDEVISGAEKQKIHKFFDDKKINHIRDM